MENAVRWNITVSKETDVDLRRFLGSKGRKRGDLSRFIEEAVRTQVFHRMVQEIKARNATTEPEDLQAEVDAAVLEVRAVKTRKRPAPSR